MRNGSTVIISLHCHRWLSFSFCSRLLRILIFFFFNDTATTEIYTLSLHDALPISGTAGRVGLRVRVPARQHVPSPRPQLRSEEHTSELQSQSNLVCRLLLEKKKKQLK